MELPETASVGGGNSESWQHLPLASEAVLAARQLGAAQESAIQICGRDSAVCSGDVFGLPLSQWLLLRARGAKPPQIRLMQTKR